MYDLKRKMYLMAHTVLPEYCAKRKNKEIKRDDLGRYTDLAIRLMVKKMRKKGSKNENIRCKIVGGGKIYNDALDIGKNNIKWAKKVLDEENIKLVSEDLGGKSSRSILSFEKDGVLKLRKNGKYYEI